MRWIVLVSATILWGVALICFVLGSLIALGGSGVAALAATPLFTFAVVAFAGASTTFGLFVLAQQHAALLERAAEQRDAVAMSQRWGQYGGH